MPNVPPPTQLIVGDRDMSGAHSGLTFSNTDPGGFEALNAAVLNLEGIRPGARVIARCGAETIFYGNVNEPGQESTGGRDSFSVAAYGPGHALKLGTMKEIYVDRDFSKWGGPSLQRQITSSPVLAQGGADVVHDATTGNPGLFQFLSKPLSAGAMQETSYNSPEIGLKGFAYGWLLQNLLTSDTNSHAYVYLANNDVYSVFEGPVDVRAAGTSGHGLTVPTSVLSGQLYQLLIQLGYTAAIAAGNENFGVLWTMLAVYGNHSLPISSGITNTDAGGYSPGQVIRDVLGRVGGFRTDGMLDDSLVYEIKHLVFYDPVTYEDVIVNVAKFSQWHWGAWEPRGLTDRRPVFYHQPVPASATCSVDRRACDDMVVPKVQRDQLYDTAIVTYQDVSGQTFHTTRTIANPYMVDAGLTGQVLNLTMGLGTLGGAQRFGDYALALAMKAARGSGSAKLPLWIQDMTGGWRPSCTLKAGRDRIRFLNLPDSGVTTFGDARQYDTFHVRRVEVGEDGHGILRTSVELDGGGDLMEVLNARLAVTNLLAA